MLSANGSFTFVYPKGIPQCMPLRGGRTSSDHVYLCKGMLRICHAMLQRIAAVLFLIVQLQKS